MSKETGISWTEHTWNPWEGCSKVSPGCAHCYMFQLLRQYGRNPGKVRRTKTWRDVERWNDEARQAGRIDRVFTCSLSDFFHKDADAWRAEAWEVIRRCDHLHFQGLTKRPLLIRERLPTDWSTGYANVWLGVSIESNDYVWRADVLREIPARIRWISAEPLLGPLPDLDLTGFQWLVVGGESGPGHRDMDHAWARQLRDMAKGQGVAFFFKQSSGVRAGRGDLLDGREWKEYPVVPPEPQTTPDADAELARREVESLRAELEKQRQKTQRVVRKWQTRYLSMRKQYEEALNAETLWRIRADGLLGRACQAEAQTRDVWQLLFGGRFVPPTGGGFMPPSVYQHLAVLGLTWPTTEDAVKAAYRDLVKRHHPDRGGNPEDFKKVQAAYDHVMKALSESGVR